MKTLSGILFSLFVLVVVALMCANAFAAEPSPTPIDENGVCVLDCPIDENGVCVLHCPVTPPVAPPVPLSAIAVSQCGLAISLFVQLDATHLLRADPRQSDMFTAVNGKMVQSTAGPMKWEDALLLAKSAVLSTNVTLPCTDVPSV